MTTGIKNPFSQHRAVRNIVKLFDEEISLEEARQIGQWDSANGDYQDKFIDTLHLLSEVDSLRDSPRMQALIDDTVRDSPRSGFRWKGIASAAVIFLAVFLGVYHFVVDVKVAPEEVSNTLRYLSRVGERKLVNLDDGSAITLNTNSEILVNITDGYRRLTLERGEVFFDVARDATRPFTVDLGTRSITVLGTSFNIRRTPQQLDVAVLEGAVAFHQTGAEVETALPLWDKDNQLTHVQTDQQQSLTAGWVATYKVEENELSTRKVEDLGSKYSWRRGMLIFDGEPLYKVVQELNRYTGKKILIEDTRVIEMKIYTALKLGRIYAALSTLEKTHPIKVVRYADRVVIVGKSSLKASENK